MRRSLLLWIACLLMAAPLACGQTAPAPAAQGSAAAATKPLETVTLRMPWLASGYDAPFILAEAKGFYKDVGLDVQVLEGKGSLLVAQTTAKGQDAFGFVDASAGIDAISKGAPGKFVAIYVQKTPMSFIFDKRYTHIGSAKDLIGKTIVSNAGDQERLFIPGILSGAGASMKDVTIRLEDMSTYTDVLVNDPHMIVTSYVTSYYPIVQKLDPSADYTSFADFGINPYNLGIETSASLLKDKPDLVKRFIAASNRGWEYTRAYPGEAVDATVAAFPKNDKAIIQRGLDVTLKMLHTPATKDHPLGWMADSDWETTLSLMKRYTGLEQVLPPDTYYTNDFIPAK